MLRCKGYITAPFDQYVFRGNFVPNRVSTNGNVKANKIIRIAGFKLFLKNALTGGSMFGNLSSKSGHLPELTSL